MLGNCIKTQYLHNMLMQIADKAHWSNGWVLVAPKCCLVTEL